MYEPFRYDQHLNYVCINLPHGPRLHFIDHKKWDTNLVSVSLNIGFGGSHLSFMDDKNRLYRFPKGMAHFMEHLLFWANMHNRLIPLKYKYSCEPNSLVTHDNTVWYIKHASSENTGNINTVCDIARNLLLLFDLAQNDKENLRSKIRKTVSDIKLEIHYRHSNLDYEMLVHLLGILHQNHPIRHDMLGDDESLGEIGIKDVQLATSLIHNNILSLTILVNGLSNDLISKVRETVISIMNQWLVSPKLTPINNEIKSLSAYKCLEGIKMDTLDKISINILGVKLLPLQLVFQSRDDLIKFYLISYLIKNYFRKSINTIISISDRIHFIKGQIEDNLFYLDESIVYEIIRSYKSSILDEFKGYKKGFNGKTKMAFYNVLARSLALVKMCLAADLYRFELTDLLDAFIIIQPSDIDILINELSESQNNTSLVYAGKYVGIV